MGIISPKSAYGIASQWGSYMNDSDPGRVFYTFPPDDARPTDEAHRIWCLEHTETCLLVAGQRAAQLGHSIEDDEDVRELRALRRFFTETSLRIERLVA